MDRIYLDALPPDGDSPRFSFIKEDDLTPRQRRELLALLKRGYTADEVERFIEEHDLAGFVGVEVHEPSPN